MCMNVLLVRCMYVCLVTIEVIWVCYVPLEVRLQIYVSYLGEC